EGVQNWNINDDAGNSYPLAGAVRPYLASIGNVSSGQAVPTVPTQLHATASANDIVQLTWTAVSGATSYSVYRGTAAGGEGLSPVFGHLTIPSFKDAGLQNGTTYYYTVTASNIHGT